MNIGGYDFVTLGNHDFNYGKEELEKYISALDARCLCANIAGIRGVEKTAIVTLQNGLRVGLAGVTTHYVKLWEKPENLAGIAVTDAFTAAKEAYDQLKAKADITVCIYHGGFERDVKTGKCCRTPMRIRAGAFAMNWALIYSLPGTSTRRQKM